MKKRLAIYLAVTFGLSWGMWIPAGIVLGATSNINSSPIMVALVAVSMFFPLIGALAANAAVPEKDRIDLCLKPRVRGNGRFYALAWFLPAVLSIAGFAVFFLVFPQLFDADMTALRETLRQGGMPDDQLGLVLAGTFAFAITAAPLINAIPAFGEEVGWRGMLFPTLCETMPQRMAVLVSGIIWGLWHAPIIAMGHNYGTGYPGHPFAGILTMILACTALGCLLAWLRLKTASVWSCAIAHGAINAVANLGSVFCTTGATVFGPSPLGLVGVIPILVLALICWRRLSADSPMEQAV